MKRLIVHTSHKASYDDPIILHLGDAITLIGKTHIWDGYVWLWAKGPEDKEGWIPDNLAVEKNGIWRARHYYSAMELTCHSGEQLQTTMQTHGWSWCTNGAGVSGWVPDKNLRSI
jgi:hypothetical protein